MEMYRIFMLHLTIFATVGVAVLAVGFAARFRRAIRLILELRRLKGTI